MADMAIAVQKALRTRYGPRFTLYEAEADLGISRGYLSLVINGKRKPSRRLLLALGLAKPDRRPGIRIRLSRGEAYLMSCGDVPDAVMDRIEAALSRNETA